MIPPRHRYLSLSPLSLTLVETAELSRDWPACDPSSESWLTAASQLLAAALMIAKPSPHLTSTETEIWQAVPCYLSLLGNNNYF